MYEIDRTAYGIRVSLNFEKEEIMNSAYADKFFLDLTTFLERLKKPIGYFFDFRNLKKLQPPEMQKLLEFKQQLVERGVIKRSVYIMNNPVSMLQMKRISKDLGLLKYERFIDINMHEDWEEKALGWLINSQDPTPKKRR